MMKLYGLYCHNFPRALATLRAVVKSKNGELVLTDVGGSGSLPSTPMGGGGGGGGGGGKSGQRPVNVSKFVEFVHACEATHQCSLEAMLKTPLQVRKGEGKGEGKEGGWEGRRE